MPQTLMETSEETTMSRRRLAASLLVLCACIALLTASVMAALDMQGTSACTSDSSSGGGLFDPPAVPVERSDSSRVSASYRLLRLTPEDPAPASQGRGSVILFIHGHRGSFGQWRALMAQLLLASGSSGPTAPSPLTAYAIDFATGPGSNPAFEARVIHAQASFVNDALRQIQSMHGPQRRIIAVGLSFGGIVARVATLQPSHPRWSPPPDLVASLANASQAATVSDAHSCFSAIVTLNSPHRAHPAFTEPAMSSLYAQLNRQWALQFAALDSPLPLLAHLSLVSITGGSRDKSVRAELTALDGIAPHSHGLHIFTSAMDAVQQEISHDDIARCPPFLRQLAQVLRASFGSTDADLMPLLRASLGSTAPIKLQLNALEPWRESTAIAGEITPEIGVAHARDSTFRSRNADVSVVSLEHPLDGLPTLGLMQPIVRAQIPSSPSCRMPYDEKGGRSQTLQSHGMYSLDLSVDPAQRERFQIVPWPHASSDWTKLVIITNVPTEFLCVALQLFDDERDGMLMPWLIDVPPEGSPVRSVLRLNREDLAPPHGVNRLELMVIDSNSRSLVGSHALNLWAKVHFISPSITRRTTKTKGSSFGTGMDARVSGVSMLALPVSTTWLPHPTSITVQSVQGPVSWPAFDPLLYSVSLPSGEAFWRSDLSHAGASWHARRNHASTQLQTIHTLLWLDPFFEYEITARIDWWALIGSCFLTWHGVIFASMFACAVLGILLQVQRYAVIAANPDVSKLLRVPPIYVLVLRGRSLVLALGLCICVSLVQASLGVRNVGMEPRFLLSFLYSIVGGSLLVVVNFLAVYSLRGVTICLTRFRSRWVGANSPTGRAISKKRPGPLLHIQRIVFLLACPLLIRAPLLTSLLALISFWCHIVWLDVRSISRRSLGSSRSIKPLAFSVGFLVSLTLSIRLVSVYQQLLWGLHWSPDRLVWSDMLYAAVCIQSLDTFSHSSLVSFEGADDSRLALRPSHLTLVLHATLIYRILALLIVFAFYFVRVHFHQTLMVTAVVCATMMICPAAAGMQSLAKRWTNRSALRPALAVDAPMDLPPSPSPNQSPDRSPDRSSDRSPTLDDLHSFVRPSAKVASAGRGIDETVDGERHPLLKMEAMNNTKQAPRNNDSLHRKDSPFDD